MASAFNVNNDVTGAWIFHGFAIEGPGKDFGKSSSELASILVPGPSSGGPHGLRVGFCDEWKRAFRDVAFLYTQILNPNFKTPYSLLKLLSWHLLSQA